MGGCPAGSAAGRTLELHGTVGAGPALSSAPVAGASHRTGSMVTGEVSWEDGGTFEVAVADFGGVAGTGWDLVTAQDAVILDDTPGSVFNIDLQSIDAGSGSFAQAPISWAPRDLTPSPF